MARRWDTFLDFLGAFGLAWGRLATRALSAFTLWVQQDLMRSAAKTAGLALLVIAVIAMWLIDHHAWALFISDDRLATTMAVLFVGVKVVILSLVGYASASAEAIEQAARGKDAPPLSFIYRLTEPKPAAAKQLRLATRLGVLVAILAFASTLYGGTNYMMHEQLQARVAANAVATVSDSREADLTAFDAAVAQRRALYESELARTPETMATARSRIMAAMNAYDKQAAEERAALLAAPSAIQTGAMTSAELAVDPRPLDAAVAQGLGLERDTVGIIRDMVAALTVILFTMALLPLIQAQPPARAAAPVKAAAQSAARSSRAKNQPRSDGKFSRPDLPPSTEPDAPDPRDGAQDADYEDQAPPPAAKDPAP